MIFFLAIGNTMRRDDGVARRVLDLLPAARGRCVPQLTPEIAAEIANASVVVFIDADAEPGDVRLEPVQESAQGQTLSHDFTPAVLVTIARRLFGFAGAAWVCRIPVSDFRTGEGLSEQAQIAAGTAARLIAVNFPTP